MKVKRPKNFTWTKVRLIKGGGLEVHHQEVTEVKGVKDTKDIKLTNTVDPHQDLVDKVEGFKEYLAECYGMKDMLMVAKSKGLTAGATKAFKTVLEFVENVHFETLDRIDITSISLSGTKEDDKDKRSVIISGTMSMQNNSKTALNSPLIKLNQDQFKFEADVQDLVNDLDEEILAYLFDNKRAEATLFDEHEKLSDDFIKGDLKVVEKEEIAEAV